MALNLSRRGRRDAVAISALALLVIIFFHSALLGGEQFFAGDTYRFFYPLKKMAADLVRAGKAPVWNPLVHSGMPLHAAIQAAVFYPFSVLFYVLPFDFAFKCYVALHVFLAAVGTYFLMRRWRLDAVPAALAGIVYAFSGYMISFIDGLNIFSSIAWAPVVFLLFERAIEKPAVAPVVIAALALSAQTLAGDPVSGYYTLLLCVAYWMVTIVTTAVRRRPRRETLSRIFVLPAIAVVVFCLCYVQIGPSQELTRYSTRTAAMSLDKATVHPIEPLRLLTLFVPYLFGNPLENIYDWGRIFAPHFPLVRSLYIGALSLLLIPIAIVVFKEKRVHFFTGVLFVSLLLSLGKYTPIYGILYKFLPMFDRFRYPTKAFFLVTFAGAVLAGFGSQYLLSDRSEEDFCVRPISARFTRFFSVAVLAATLLWVVLAACDNFFFDLSDNIFISLSSADPALTARFIPHMKKEILQASLMFAAVGAGLWVWRRGMLSTNLFRVLVVGFIALDLIPINYRAMATIAEDFYTPPQIVSEAPPDSGLFRLYRTPLDVEQRIQGVEIETPVEYYLWNRELLSPNFGTLFGYSYTDGYESANLLWHNLFVRFVESSPPLLRPKLLGLVNVRYVFSSHPVSHPFLSLKGNPADNVFVYENMKCLPRAYFVPTAVVASSEEVALNFLGSAAFEPARAVVLVETGGPGSLNPVAGFGGFEVEMPADFRFTDMNVNDPSPFSTPDIKQHEAPVRAEVALYSFDTVELTVDAPSDGYVVLCDSYYPKWKASVNGSNVNVLRANCTVRAVPVSEGANRISFVYDRSSFRRGVSVSFAALFFCFGAVVIALVRRRFHSGEPARAHTVKDQ